MPQIEIFKKNQKRLKINFYLKLEKFNINDNKLNTIDINNNKSDYAKT